MVVRWSYYANPLVCPVPKEHPAGSRLAGRGLMTAPRAICSNEPNTERVLGTLACTLYVVVFARQTLVSALAFGARLWQETERERGREGEAREQLREEELRTVDCGAANQG